MHPEPHQRAHTTPDANASDTIRSPSAWTKPSMKTYRRILSVAALLLASTAGDVYCASLNWPAQEYPYVAVRQSVPEALRALGRHMGVSMALSPTIDGVIHGRVPTGSARDFLDFVCQTYGLVWYYDGAILEVVPQSETRSVVVLLKNITPNRLKYALMEMDVWDPRFFYSANQDLRLAHISGPPRYVDIVSKVAEKLEHSHPRSVKVIRGGQPDNAAAINKLDLKDLTSNGLVRPLD